MKTYNLSFIMARAWEIKKENKNNIWALCLKTAWAEAKKPQKSKKEALIDALNIKIAEANLHENGFHYKASVSEWENYGKSRTYFAIIETRENSTHHSKKTYGFFDNKTGEYVADKYGDLTDKYTFSGAPCPVFYPSK